MILIIAISLLIGGGVGYELKSSKEDKEVRNFHITKACYKTGYQNAWLPQNMPEELKNNITTTCELNIHQELSK